MAQGEAKADITQAAERMGIPLWGRILIRCLWPVGAFYLAAFGVVFWQLYSLNRDVGKLDGKIERIPLSLSKTLLEQSDKSASTGKEAEAVRAVQFATALLTDARKEKIRVAPDYFKQVSQQLTSLQSVARTPDLRRQVHATRVQLAEYRSALEPVPYSVGTKIQMVESTTRLTPSPGRVTFLDMGDTTFDGSRLPPDADFFSVPTGNTDPISTSIKRFVNGSQLLDGIQWTDAVFVHTHIKYSGGLLDLHNVQFVDCAFRIEDNPAGDELAEAVALGLSSITHAVNPPIRFLPRP